uniref:Uncharacterized protein n=1 Tax=Arundo donax TaxID=35708 RepID=A0A0A9AII0_ARUDO
MAGFHHLV